MSIFSKLFSILAFFILSFGIATISISAAAPATLLPTNGVICGASNVNCAVTNGTTVTGAEGVTTTLINIARIITYISGGLSVLFIVYGGVRYLTSGTEKDAGDARTIVQNAIIGLVITVIAYAIISIVTGLLSGQFIG
jgi:hypothetical protein